MAATSEGGGRGSASRKRTLKNTSFPPHRWGFCLPSLNLAAPKSVKRGFTMADRLPTFPEPRGTDTDDWRLMREIARGSEDAFRDLIGRYQDVLLHLFARLGARHDEADDAAQETFLRVHAYRERYQPTGSFRTFLFTVARRAWLDLCRRRERRRRREVPGCDLESLPRPEGLGLDRRLDLEAALNKLSEGHRMVLVLSIWGGLKYEEIAEVMGIPEGTVKSRVFHALRKLRARLSPTSAG